MGCVKPAHPKGCDLESNPLVFLTRKGVLILPFLSSPFWASAEFEFPQKGERKNAQGLLPFQKVAPTC